MTSSIRLKEMDSKSPDLPEVLAPDRVPRLRPSWEKESFNGKLKRLWILKVCGTGNANRRIEVRKGEISSIGADVVVAQSDIKTILNLKGKKLGANLGGFSEVFVSEMLKTSKLTSDDVRVVKAEALEVPQRIQNNAIQAGHTWEPYLSEALKLGANILFTSKQTPGLILDVVAFRGEVIRDRPEDIRAFVRGWLQALSYWETNIPEGNEIASQGLNIPSNTMSLEGIDLTDFAENKKFFQSDSPNYIYKTAQKYAEFFIRTGNVTRLPNLETLFNSSFLTPPPSLKP